MPIKTLVAAVAALIISTGFIFTGHAEAQTVLTGQTASGAFYRIEVPDGWQAADGLVIWNHGFDMDADRRGDPRRSRAAGRRPTRRGLRGGRLEL